MNRTLKTHRSRAIACLALLFALGHVPLLMAARGLVGTSGAQFLRIGVHARALGMGEAYTAVSDGAESIYWNPAGLARVQSREISVMHAAYLQEVQYDFASYAQPIKTLGSFGLGMQYLSGKALDRVDEFGSVSGSFKPYDMAMTAGWGRRWSAFGSDNNVNFGIAAKFIQSKITRTANSAAVDAGVQWEVKKEKLWAAFVFQNMGPAMKFREEGDDLPLAIKAGAAYRLYNPLLLAADVSFPRDNQPDASLGGEYKKRLNQELWVAGRSGFNSRVISDLNELTSLSMGAGIGWKRYQFDFAWVPFGPLGHAYRFSLSARF